MLFFFIILLFLVTRYGSWGRIKLYGRMIDKHNNIQAYLARYGLWAHTIDALHHQTGSLMSRALYPAP
jgi:hypothetical protein